MNSNCIINQLDNIKWPNIKSDHFYEELDTIFNKLGLILPSNYKDTYNKCNQTKNAKFECYHELISLYLSPNTPYRSLMLYHSIGSGKTLTSFKVISNFINKPTQGADGNPTDWTIYFVCPPGLVSYVSNEINKFSSILPKSFKHKFYRISYISFANRLAGKTRWEIGPYKGQLIKDNSENRLLENSLVVIDEIHNIHSSDTNIKNAFNVIYKSIRQCKNIKLLTLTGTPIKREPYEIGRVINILKHIDDRDILPEEKTNFNDKFFEIDKQTNISSLNKDNIGIFFNSIKGYISYRNIENDLNIFARKIDMEKQIVSMSNLQYQQYNRNIKNCDNDKCLHNSRVSNIVNGYQIPKEFIKIMKNLKQYSPKLDLLSKNIEKHHKSKHLIYSYHQAHGVRIVKELLLYKQWRQIDRRIISKCFKNGNDIFKNDFKLEINEDFINEFMRLSKNNFIVLDSYTSSKKMEILAQELYNLPINKNGDFIRVFLVNRRYKEGISLLDTNFVHILEPPINTSDKNQIIGRVLRYCSHNRLPYPNKWFVKVYVYYSTFPNNTTTKIKSGLEKEKLLEKERELEKEKLLEKEKEIEEKRKLKELKERELLEKIREDERKKELEKKLEKERQEQIERQKQLENEIMREKLQQLERQKQLEKEIMKDKLLENDRKKQLENEIMKDTLLEKERQKQLENEINRYKLQEKEREKQLEKELEIEKLQEKEKEKLLEKKKKQEQERELERELERLLETGEELEISDTNQIYDIDDSIEQSGGSTIDECNSNDLYQYNNETNRCEMIPTDLAFNKIADRDYVLLTSIDIILKQSAIDCLVYKYSNNPNIQCSIGKEIVEEYIGDTNIDNNSNCEQIINYKQCKQNPTCYWKPLTNIRGSTKYKPSYCHKKDSNKIYCSDFNDNKTQCIDNNCSWNDTNNIIGNNCQDIIFEKLDKYSNSISIETTNNNNIISPLDNITKNLLTEQLNILESTISTINNYSLIIEYLTLVSFILINYSKDINTKQILTIIDKIEQTKKIFIDDMIDKMIYQIKQYINYGNKFTINTENINDKYPNIIAKKHYFYAKLPNEKMFVPMHFRFKINIDNNKLYIDSSKLLDGIRNSIYSDHSIITFYNNDYYFTIQLIINNGLFKELYLEVYKNTFSMYYLSISPLDIEKKYINRLNTKNKSIKKLSKEANDIINKYTKKSTKNSKTKDTVKKSNKIVDDILKKYSVKKPKEWWNFWD